MELNFETLSFKEAVRLFKEWGYLVEPGPRPEEVTLLIKGPAHRSYHVYDAAELPQLAAAILRVRCTTGAILAPHWVVDKQMG